MSEEKLPKVRYTLGSHGKKYVRFSYLNAHTPKVNSESGEEQFGCVALIPKTNTEDIAFIKDAVKKFQKAVFLDKGKKVPPNFWNPLRDGDEDCKQDGSSYGAECKGHYVLAAKTGVDNPPNVVGSAKDENGKFLALGKRDIKSGDWGRLTVNLVPFTKGVTGVSAYLSTVQKKVSGESLGGSSSAEDDLAEFEDDDEDDDPMMD